MAILALVSVAVQDFNVKPSGLLAQDFNLLADGGDMRLRLLAQGVDVLVDGGDVA